MIINSPKIKLIHNFLGKLIYVILVLFPFNGYCCAYVIDYMVFIKVVITDMLLGYESIIYKHILF